MSQGQVAAAFKVLQYMCFYPKLHRTRKQDQARRVNNIMAVLDMPAIFDMLKTFCLHVFVKERSSWKRLAYLLMDKMVHKTNWATSSVSNWIWHQQPQHEQLCVDPFKQLSKDVTLHQHVATQDIQVMVDFSVTLVTHGGPRNKKNNCSCFSLYIGCPFAGVPILCRKTIF